MIDIDYPFEEYDLEEDIKQSSDSHLILRLVNIQKELQSLSTRDEFAIDDLEQVRTEISNALISRGYSSKEISGKIKLMLL